MLLNATRFESVNSQPELILLAIEDITERKRTEVAVQTSEVRYRRLFETAKDGILILDADTWKNHRRQPIHDRVVGLHARRVLGQGTVGDRSVQRQTGQSKPPIRELQAKGYIRYDHLPLETKHGNRPRSSSSATSIRWTAGPSLSATSETSANAAAWSGRLQEQTEALADLHRRKDEFLAMLSHELRSPLAPISNAVQLLRLRKNEDPLQQQARTIIERQVAQLTRLVDDLMEVSRITTGRIHLQRERVALNGIVENAVETVRPLIGSTPA